LDETLVSYLTSREIEFVDNLTIDVIAQEADVSRASAYRHFGDRDGLLHRAAALLVMHHADLTRQAMAPIPTVLGKVEESFAYTAREIQCDSMMRTLLTAARPDVVAEVVKGISLDLLGGFLKAGQLAGEVRDDVPVIELIDWLWEMSQAMIRMNLNEEAARRWVRLYVAPAMRPQGQSSSFTAGELQSTLAQAQGQIEEAHRLVRGLHELITEWA
jgi:AcrR family transcriptional regulator